MGWCCHTAKSLDWQPGQVGKMKLDKVSLSGKKWGPILFVKMHILWGGVWRNRAFSSLRPPHYPGLLIRCPGGK